MIEQIGEDIALLKTRRETCRERAHPEDLGGRDRPPAGARGPSSRPWWRRSAEHPDLARRLELICSVAGVGMQTAVAILVRMPEIGRSPANRRQHLPGLPPTTRTAASKSARVTSTAAARRLRRALYAAALPASFRWNPQLMALYKRLTAGKGHKRALIACARKLLISVNAVVARGTPWQEERPPTVVLAATG